MNTFNKANLKTIRADLDAALAQVAAAHGIDLKIGGIRFDETSFKATLEASVAGLGIEDTKEGQAFLAHHAEHKFKREDLGREFKFEDKTLKVIGFNMKNPKNLVALEVVGTGQKLKAPARSVWMWLREDELKAAS